MLADIRCRICEELVSAVLFEEHSKWCAQSTACEKRVAEAEDRMQRLVASITDKIQENTSDSPDKIAFVTLGRSQTDLLSSVQRIIKEAIRAPFSTDVPKILNEYAKQVGSSFSRRRLLFVCLAISLYLSLSLPVYHLLLKCVGLVWLTVLLARCS
jgi:hypothetical protein